MKTVSFLTVLAGVQLAFGVAVAVADAPVPPPAATAPAAPAPEGTRVRGPVTKVDTDAKSVTVTDRRDQSDVTFTVNDDTKYTVNFLEKVSDLKVGDKIVVFGDTSGTTVTADGIMVQGPQPPRPGNGPGPGSFGTRGEITAVSPLTLKTDDSQTLTVTTTDDTNVIGIKPGTLADVAVDDFVTAELDANNVAKRVQVRPANLPRFGRRRGN
jgi:Cu/Ag efflux protein CusF